MAINAAHRTLSIVLLVACLSFSFSGVARASIVSTEGANLDVWTDPAADAGDPALDLISGAATVTSGGALELRAQFAGVPFSTTSGQTITWCFDTDQNPVTGTACGEGALAGADQVITLQGGPDALATGDLHLGGALLGEDACQLVRYEESSQTLFLKLPQVYIDADGIFNSFVMTQSTGSESIADAAPDNPSFAIPGGAFLTSPSATAYLPETGLQMCNYLWMDPSRLEFVGYQGGDDPKKQTLDIFDNEEAGIDWVATEDIPWLTLSFTSGVTPSHIQVSVTSAGMPAGLNTGRIYFTRPGRQWNGSNWLEVSLEVRQASSFDISPKALDFEGYEGQLATPIKLLDIAKIGEYDLEWQLSEDIPWLHVSPEISDDHASWYPHGTAPSRLLVWATPAQLAPGQYTGEITITSDNARNSPQVIPVNLTVTKYIKQGHTIGLTSSNDDEGYIRLNWTPVDNPQFAGYRVYVWQQNTTRYAYIGTLLNLTYIDHSIDRRPYTDYCYYVAAVNPNGTSFIADSSVVCAKTGRLLPPPIDLEP